MKQGWIFPAIQPPTRHVPMHSILHQLPLQDAPFFFFRRTEAYGRDCELISNSHCPLLFGKRTLIFGERREQCNHVKWSISQNFFAAMCGHLESPSQWDLIRNVVWDFQKGGLKVVDSVERCRFFTLFPVRNQIWQLEPQPPPWNKRWPWRWKPESG